MGTKLTNIEAIKAYFEATDKHAPTGGRQVKMEDYKLSTGGNMPVADRKELAEACIARMNAEPAVYGNASDKGPAPYEIG